MGTLVMSPLATLVHSLKRSASEKDHLALSTKDFVESAEAILPFFDHLGPVFSVARHEFTSKLATLREASASYARLSDVVRADAAQQRSTAKNSCTRNLHRIAAAISFIKILFNRLLRSPDALLRDAASEAYEATLAPFHTLFIRGAVRAGMLTLPSREHFMASIGETEESAAPRCEDVIASCSAVIVVVEKLLEGIEFPVSDVWFWPSA